MPKAAVIKPCHNVTYIHDSDEDAAQDADVYDRISYDDLIAPPTLLAPREDEGWEVVDKSTFACVCWPPLSDRSAVTYRFDSRGPHQQGAPAVVV